MKLTILVIMVGGVLSPPVRGAWIETMKHAPCEVMPVSPPVRGAWIETCSGPLNPQNRPGRPPCGGRGLKPFCNS